MHVDVLICGSPEDPHVASVVRHLSHMGASTFCLEQPRIWADTVTFSPTDAVLTFGETAITSCGVIWYRRGYPDILDFVRTGEQEFARSEFEHCIMGALLSLTDNWLSHPSALRHSDFKALQLRWVARDARVRVPRTVLSSSEARVRTFLADEATEAIVKPVHYPVVRSEPFFKRVYTHPVDDQVRQKLGDVRHAPCIFQDFIERRSDIRLTVIGERAFCVGMVSSQSDHTKYDYRLNFDYRQIDHQILDAPEPVVGMCLDFCRRFKLGFAAFDFVEGLDGHWYFLEVNANGQWFWIEEMTGLPLARTLAEALVSRAQNPS